MTMADDDRGRPAPVLLTFDVFGTLVNWRAGLRAAVESNGNHLSDADFDRVIDAQAADESGPFRTYREIAAQSLVAVLGLARSDADRIASEAGRWPLFPDVRDAMLRLSRKIPCVAMTNSDRAHGEQVHEQLGFRLAGWLCAEEVRVYKPSAEFWRLVGARFGVAPGPHWVHVSAYDDYDLDTARELGLTTVFVSRPHFRRGPADLLVPDLSALADKLVGA